MNLTKRQKIIIASVIMTLGLILSTLSANFIFIRYQLIIGLGLLSYIVTIWALWEGMTKTKAVILLILPTFYAVAVASFYYLLPVRWLTRVPIAIGFGASFYTLLLSQNVFNVASATRTIPLYRAASTASFLFTLITGFFLFNVLSGFDLPFYWNGVVVFLISLPLCLQLLWTVEMEKVSLSVLVYSLVASIIGGEGALALSFWPVVPTIWSLFLATILYVILGVLMEKMRDRLTNRVVVEYIGVFGLVLIFSILVTQWG